MHRRDGLGHLLAVGADVLDRRRTRPCRGCRTAPRHRSTPLDGTLDERVPVLTRLDDHLGAAARVAADLDAGRGDADDRARRSPRRPPPGCCRRRAPAPAHRPRRRPRPRRRALSSRRLDEPRAPGRRAAASSSRQPRAVGRRRAAVDSVTPAPWPCSCPSTFWSALVTVRSIVATPSSTDFTAPSTGTDVPSSSSGTTTGLVNRAPRAEHRLGSPAHAVTASPASAKRVHPVRDHSRQPDRRRDPVAPVDRVEVAGRTGVADQVGRGVTSERPRLEAPRPGLPARVIDAVRRSRRRDARGPSVAYAVATGSPSTV